MHPWIKFASVVCIVVFISHVSVAQEAVVPRVIQFSGIAENVRGGLIPQAKSVTFALYSNQREGAPLWQETQNVTIDSERRFEVLLGAASREGLPVDLFVKGEPRWLGFQLNGTEGEQPRVLLGSVPYALKAADADTLGGRPLSAFVLADGPSAAIEARPAKNVNCTNPCINSFEIEDGAITDADISASAGIAPMKIAGTAATVGPNTFTGTQTINSGNLLLPNTTNSTAGVLMKGINRFLHNFGSNNTFLGGDAGNFSMSGQQNTGIGLQALMNNGAGSDNVAVGVATMAANSSGIQNTAIGNAALITNTTGSFNTAIGELAGHSGIPTNANTTGSFNTFIDRFSGPGISTQLNNATAIGANARVSASHALVLGDDFVSVGIGTQAPLTKLQVVGNIRVGTSGTNGCVQGFDGSPIAGTCSSDIRLKQNIEPFAPVAQKLVQLQPISYEWNADEHPEYHFGAGRTNGLIAQEVEKVFPNMVSTDERGYKAVNYSQLPLLLLQAMREQQAQIQELKSELEQLRALHSQESSQLK